MDNKSLTDRIYDELVDGLKTEQDYTHLRAKYDANKGPFYNALGRLFHDMWPKVQESTEVQAKLDHAGLELDSMDLRIKEAKNNIAALEEKRNVLNEQVGVVETKLAEKRKILGHAGELAKLGFDIERLRQLREVLTEIGAKLGLKAKEAVSKFFDELKDYDTKTGLEAEVQRLGTITETRKLEAEKWQAEEEALKRKHDDRKEAVGTVHALLAKGMKVSQIITLYRILNTVESIEQFDEHLRQYGNITQLLSARKEEAESYELRLTKAQSQVQTLEKEKAKIEGAIESLKVVGIKELKAMTEATEKQLKAVAASEIREAQALGQEVRSEFANYFTQLDKLLEKAVHLGQELEKSKQRLQKYEAVKGTLESHVAASEEASEPIPK